MRPARSWLCALLCAGLLAGGVAVGLARPAVAADQPEARKGVDQAASGTTPGTARPLTGEWDTDVQGYFYLHQVGDMLYGYGESNTQVPRAMALEPDDTQPAWATVMVGRVAGGCVRGTWARVPKGRASGKHGRFTLAVLADGNVLAVVHEFGGLGPRRLVRIAYINSGDWATRKLPTPPPGACASPPAGDAKPD